MTPDQLEARAKELHRAWARHTIRRMTRLGPEAPEEAHARRWASMAQRVRDEFLAEAGSESLVAQGFPGA